MNPSQLKGNLDMLLLSVLEGSPAHGYIVIARLRDRSAGTFDLPEGTVYPALHRLERLGLLSSSWDVAEGRKRRVYEITAPGVRALHDQREGWSLFSGAIASVIGSPA